MTASRVDPLPCLSSTRSIPMLFASLAGVVLAACRAGLPPEPPGADPTDPAASSAPYQVQPNPYETSAFAGDQGPKAGEHAGHGNMDHGSMKHGQAGHEHMGHGAPAAPAEPDHSGHGAKTGGKQVPAPAAPAEPDHSGHGPKAGGKQAPAPTAPAEPDHSGHGAAKKKPSADSETTHPNMHEQPEAPR